GPCRRPVREPPREGVRAPRSLLPSARHRPDARPSARRGLGLRVSGGDEDCRRPSEAAEGQGHGRRGEDRDGVGRRIQAGGSRVSVTQSIATRLFLSYLAVVLVGTVAAGVTISGLLLRYENDQTKLRLEELSAPFLTAIQTGVRAGQQPRDIVASLTEQAPAADSRLLITTPLRRVVVDSEGTLINAQLPQPSASNIGEFTDGDEQWIFVRQQLRQAVASAGGLGFIVVARPRAVFTDTL